MLSRRRSVPVAIAAVGLALLTGLTACGGDDAEEPSGGSGEEAAQPVELKVQTTLPIETVFFYPLVVARELGYFEEEGVAPEFFANNETPGPALIASGQVDLSDGDTAAALQGIAEGGDYKAIYVPNPTTSDRLISTDPEVQSVEDLPGKQVALATREQITYLEAVLANAGVDPKQVKTVIIDGAPAVANALKTGRASAYASSVAGSMLLEAALGGDLEVTNITPTDDRTLAQTVIATPETIESNADAVEGFLRAFSKGTYAGQVAPDAVEEIMRKAGPDEWRDEATGEALFKASLELYKPDDSEQIGQLLPEYWQNQMDQLLEADELKQPVELDALLDDRFIQPANDWDRDEVQAQVEQWVQDNK